MTPSRIAAAIPSSFVTRMSFVFYACCKHVKRTWKDYLPIQTAGVRITRFNLLFFVRDSESFIYVTSPPQAS